MQRKEAIMIELTPEQHQALGADALPRVRDPETNETYVLVKAAVFERFRRLLEHEDDGLDMRQVAVLIEEAMREDDANDPLLESYQNYQRRS
jgi:hypothetical protein